MTEFSVDGREYESLAVDVRSIQIATWRDAESDHEIYFHIFPNRVGIVETTLRDIEVENSGLLERQIQDLSAKLIQDAFQRFSVFMEQLYVAVDHAFSQKIEHGHQSIADGPRIFWSSRVLILSEAQIQKPVWQGIIRDWLSNTENPKDADAIIAGRQDYSMTWLNYVVVKPKSERQDYRIKAMILAQYFYTAQEICNLQLRNAIASAYVNEKLLEAQQGLERSRVAANLHIISFHEHVKYLTRPKRRVLDEILKSWEFDQLVENGQRMVDVCSNRIQEANARRRERSSTMTDLLLVALSFFAVFELAIYLTEYSREVMSRPALDYTDDRPSFFLSFIAGIDADIMFSLGFCATLLLIIIYRFIKTR
ncbi:MAG: hypothetical protein KZQ78_06965 [Candidatus Thiodiazotropha sp. (ex Ustalcina ferruginea)]|nr:hypothetical protein [Candidatus Thiodiazotropha sp. (ex Ustalcina ferruginea)]